MASLLACPGASAWATACPSGAVTQASGTSSGSLSYALANGNCADLSTSVGGGTYTLGQNAALTAPATIYLETTGSAAAYTLAGSASPTKLLMFDEVPTVVLDFAADTVSGAAAPVTLTLAPSVAFSVLTAGNAVAEIGQGVSLAVASGAPLGSGLTVRLDGGSGPLSAALDFQGNTTVDGNLSLAGSGTSALHTNGHSVYVTGGAYGGATLGNSAMLIDGGGSVVIGGNLEPYAGVDVAAGTTLTVAGGGTVAIGGTLQADGTVDLRAASSNPTVQSLAGATTGVLELGGSTLTINYGSSDFAGNISGTGGIFVQGGTQVLSGVDGDSGETLIAGGATLQLGSSATMTASPVQADGTLDLSAQSGGSTLLSLGGSGRVTLGGQVLTISTADPSMNFSGRISGSGSLHIATGTQVLSGNNVYSGSTVIDPGATLALRGGGSLGSSPVVDNGSLDISATSAGVTLASLSGTGGVSLGSQTLTLNNGGGNTLGGVIQGSGGLDLLAGTQTLTGTNNYQGSTSIASGATLALAGHGSVGSSPVADEGTFDISGTTSGASVGSIAGNGGVSLGSQTLTVTSGSGTLGGSITGSGGLSITGGNETLSATNFYTGQTAIAAGATLTLTHDGGLYSGSSTLDNGTLVLVYATQGLGTAIDGSGGVTVNGGVAALSAVNGYSGATNIEAGSTLNLFGSGSIASSAVSDDGMLDISMANGPRSVASIAGSGAVALGANTLTVTQASGELMGAISGSGGLEIAAGTQTLSGNNNYTGNTAIDAGATLALARNGTLSLTPVVDNGTLDISSAAGSPTVKSISGTGGVVLGGGNTLTVVNASGSLDGVLSGSGGLHIVAGTQTLGTGETYHGVTTVDAGATLRLSGNASIPSSAVNDDGTLDISTTTAGASVSSLAGSGTVNLGSNTLDITQAQGSFDGGITGAGGLSLDSGNEVLGGANSFLGGTTVQGGTLGLANGSSLASGLVVQSGGSVQAGSASVAGSVSNGGTLRIGSTAAPNATLSVGGSYTQGANGVLSLAISPSSNSQLVVNGPSLNLGGTLRVSAAPGNYLKTTYVLVQAPATTVLNGRFSQLQLTGLGSQYAYQLTYLSDPQVLLSLYQANSFQ
ncbi:autotransporter-associated beta strand repeat-containing protein [Thiomonas sp. FB-6]|uniref:beta strand repeat-containing protein n=1 Tax=Thiomonas sp. FB-6 TaxID=1158291 RepID=UPI00037F981C|nr:autotransporter-associated beta strand repeat-containing protein [Thiomonas sp. FB-6]